MQEEGDPHDSARRDLVDMLRDLAVLRDRGELDEAQFQRARIELLAQYESSKPPDPDAG
jgi:hypothetical protein